MPKQSLKSFLRTLPLAKKLLIVSGIVGIISVLLPWYKDIDRFNTGDMFWGFSGPLYLVGFSLLMGFGASLAMAFLRSSKLKKIEMPLADSTFHFLVAGFGFYQLIVAASVYFHPKFGLNILYKEPLVGMFMAFGALALMSVGAFLEHRDEEYEHPLMASLEADPQLGLSSAGEDVVARAHRNVEMTLESALAGGVDVPVTSGVGNVVDSGGTDTVESNHHSL